jgi:protoporphyrinogen oxidase
MKPIAILGAGLAGLGAANILNDKSIPAIVYEKCLHVGGQAASYDYQGGWIFDDGPHISFTKNERMRDLFASNVEGNFLSFHANVNNLWNGYWIKHPAQANLYGLPTQLLVRIMEEMIRAQFAEYGEIRNYKDWLFASFGRTFSETFPMEYGWKFHTTTADNMTTDWIGPRLYRADLGEILRGALEPNAGDVHYISNFRYPTSGGFVKFVEPFTRKADVRFGMDVVSISLGAGRLGFADGHVEYFDQLISSIPLPELISRIEEATPDVRAAAERLACSTCVIVDIGIDREDISPAHWSYFYDREYSFSRLSFPHMFSSCNVPSGAGSIQAEIYFSKKYRPLTVSPESLIDVVIKDLRRCGLLRDTDSILIKAAHVVPYANVIFDLERPAALETIREFLAAAGVETCGRYGEWNYLWSDESFMSGEQSAQRIIDRVGRC